MLRELRLPPYRHPTSVSSLVFCNVETNCKKKKEKEEEELTEANKEDAEGEFLIPRPPKRGTAAERPDNPNQGPKGVIAGFRSLLGSLIIKNNHR